jgi:hypothetical protein
MANTVWQALGRLRPDAPPAPAPASHPTSASASHPAPAPAPAPHSALVSHLDYASRQPLALRLHRVAPPSPPHAMHPQRRAPSPVVAPSLVTSRPPPCSVSTALRSRHNVSSPLVATYMYSHCNIQMKHLQHTCKTAETFITYTCNIRLKQLKHLEHALATYVHSHCNIYNTGSTFATSR